MNPWDSPTNAIRTRTLTVAVVATLLVFVGSFMPWVAAPAQFLAEVSTSATGGGRDGIFTISLAVISFVTLVVLLIGDDWERIKLVSIVVLALGLAGTAIGINDYVYIQSELLTDPELAESFPDMETTIAWREFVDDLERGGSVSVGAGLYVVLVGSGILVASAAFSTYMSFRRAPVRQEPLK